MRKAVADDFGIASLQICLLICQLHGDNSVRRIDIPFESSVVGELILWSLALYVSSSGQDSRRNRAGQR